VISPLEEGSRLLVAASFEDPDADKWWVTIDYGDGGAAEVIPFAPNVADKTFHLDHHYGNQGVYPLTVTVRDDKGAFDTYSTTLTVINATPVLTVPESARASEGQHLQIYDLGLVSDGGFDDRPITYSVDWGDGTELVTGAATIDRSGGPGETLLASFDGGHTYADDGQYTVTVSVWDVDEANATETFIVTVDNTAPRIELTEDAFDVSVEEGSVLQFDTLVSIADFGFQNLTNLAGASDETFSFVVDWGDGVAPDSGTASIDRYGSAGVETLASFGAEHIYADNGEYRVSVTVTDDDGGVATAEFGVVVQNVAPALLPIDDQTLVTVQY